MRGAEVISTWECQNHSHADYLFRGDLFTAVTFAAVTLTAEFFSSGFFLVVAFSDDFLYLVTCERPVLFRSRAGSILAAPAPGANKLSWPSFHRTRYWTRSAPSTTSMISPSRGGPPTLAAWTTMRSPFLATGLLPVSSALSVAVRPARSLSRSLRSFAGDLCARRSGPTSKPGAAPFGQLAFPP
jgi:hypothetical protein